MKSEKLRLKLLWQFLKIYIFLKLPKEFFPSLFTLHSYLFTKKCFALFFNCSKLYISIIHNLHIIIPVFIQIKSNLNKYWLSDLKFLNHSITMCYIAIYQFSIFLYYLHGYNVNAPLLTIRYF